jgi:ribose/xylose/arabinose/galactoside ABC-type transport system permease subunit
VAERPTPSWLPRGLRQRPAPSAPRARPTFRSARLARIFARFPEAGILLATLATFAGWSIFADEFLTTDNLLSIGQQISYLGIVAVGLTFLLIAGELDLSVGSMYGFLAIIFAELVVNQGVNLVLGIALTILLGIGIGFVNGFVTTQFLIPSFIVTLGMLGVLRGGALVVSGGLPIGTVTDQTFYNVSAGLYFGETVPAQVFWLAGVMFVAAIVLAFTKFGYQVYATGGNRLAAAHAGINTRRTKLLCFMLTGGLVGLIGVLSVGWLGTANPLTGQGFELQVIAAVVIGGTSLFGGAGSIFGTFLGAAIIGMISNGLVLVGVDQYWQQLVTGAIIVAAALLNVTLRRAAVPEEV